MSFGGHLRALRDEAGLSRAALARRAGVPASTLRHWEGDRGFPALAACLRLAGALGVPVERFAEGVEDPAEDEPELGQETSQQVRQGKTPRRRRSGLPGL
jgi:transcriptional regulator with XRE-family HTH domain